MISIGLDFGTGNSALAFWRGSEAHTFDALGKDGAIPSDILVDSDGVVDSDPRHLLSPPADFRRETAIKRRLLSLRSGDCQQRPYLVSLAVARLKYVYDAFTDRTQETVAKGVLTCPANTGQAYRDTLLDIGRRVGLPKVDIVDEPTAAAVHQGLDAVPTQNERWMVVDWGCGTCDVSLIERKADQPDLLVQCVRGDNELGGMDMDVLLRDYLAEQHHFDPTMCRSWEVEPLKMQLSNVDHASATLTLTNGREVDVEISRLELVRLIEPLLTRARRLIRDAMEEQHWRDVDYCIATGGPILMPSVRRTIAETIGWYEQDINWNEPMTSVAQGAARLAELKRRGGLVVTNRVAQSIGVRVIDGEDDDVYHRIIRRDETRPVARETTLTTSTDLQDIIAIELREGDNDSALSNTLLGRVNVVVRPEKQGVVEVKLRLHLSDSSAKEVLVEPVGDPNTVRQVEIAGFRIEPGEHPVEEDELRLGDPVDEFQAQIESREVDPDTARQLYERLKVKYHPDRDPENRAHWNARLTALDKAFNAYLADVERRMRASTLPDLPWDEPSALDQVVVDEVLAQRLTHCLAQKIAGAEMRPRLIALLKRFPDYRRVLASYLFGVGRNAVLRELLATDDRPHVGLVVLLQNLPDKPIRERHEVLKAAYRLPDERVREMLRNPNLNAEELYETVPEEAPEQVSPFGGSGSGGGVPHVELTFEYRDGNTYIGGDTYPVKDRLKQLGCRWDPENKVWYAKDRRLTEEDVWSDDTDETTQGVPRVNLTFGYRDGNTYIDGNTYPVKERLKELGCRWDGRNKVWYATGERLTEEDVWPDA